VLQVNKLYPPHIGGVEQVTRLLAEGLNQRQGMQAGVLVCNEGFRTINQTLNGVEITRVGSLGRVRSEPISLSFPFHLRRAEADIYHFHTPFPLGELSGLMLGKEKALVTWYHSDVVRQRISLAFYRPLLRRFLSRNRAIIVSSPNLVESSPFLRPLAHRCRVVHFGIDVERFQPTQRVLEGAARIRERYADAGGLVLFVGRLVYYKGLICLLEAMREVDASLLILGTGPLQRELEKRIEAQGMSGRVRFVTEVEEEEIPFFYHACDLLVLPSTARSEAFGLVLLEAQACGKPVISTELGTGTSYANLDGKTGLVVPPGDSRVLAGAMARLLGDAVFRDALGSRGRERVQEEFNLSSMVDGVANIYREVMKGDL
jgi:glycosyltransferase involved in cell wall biosynthesis